MLPIRQNSTPHYPQHGLEWGEALPHFSRAGIENRVICRGVGSCESQWTHRLSWGGYHLITARGVEIKSSNHRLLCGGMLLPYFRAWKKVEFCLKTLQGKGTILLMLCSCESQGLTHRLCWRELPPCKFWWGGRQSSLQALLRKGTASLLSREEEKSEFDPQAPLEGDISLLLQVGEGCVWDKALVMDTAAVMPVGVWGGIDFIVMFS